MSRRRVGQVRALFRYPVKSMRAEPMMETVISWHGIPGDRRWAFVRPGTQRNGFPWLTLRQRADLTQFRALITDPKQPDRSRVVIETGNKTTLDVTDPAMTLVLGCEARVIKIDRGIFDTAPLSLITTDTVQRLADAVGRAGLEVQRFRPNLLIDTGSDRPFPEDAWVGSVLGIGTAEIRVDRLDQRCSIINLDPATGARDPSILRAVAAQRDLQAGAYATTVVPGLIAVGDNVYLHRGSRR